MSQPVQGGRCSDASTFTSLLEHLLKIVGIIGRTLFCEKRVMKYERGGAVYVFGSTEWGGLCFRIH